MALRSNCSYIFFRIGVLKIFEKFSQENSSVGVFLNKVTGRQVFTPLQLFLCESFHIFDNSFFTEHLRWLLLGTGINSNTIFFLREVRFHGVVGIIHEATWFRSI